MMIKYTFFDGGTINFDDEKRVKDLIRYAFDEFEYFEPIGMEYVTIFQCHHSKTNTGWFTTDINNTCREEIENPDELCFAYHMPEVFYFAEGGWGHHMRELGNHPEIPNAVEIILRFTDFYNTVVINGKYCLNDIVHFLKKSEYISAASKMIRIIAVYGNLSSYLNNSYIIPLSDPIMNVKLSDFDEEILKYHSQYLETTNYLYHYIIEFVENV